MKQMFVLALVFGSLSAQAGELETFKDVVDAVSQGKQISFVIHFNECISEMPLSTATASITPNAVLVIDNNRITASDRHFTMDDPVRRGAPVYDYSKFTINAEGDALIKTTAMSAIDYEPLASHQINCELGKGFKVFG